MSESPPSPEFQVQYQFAPGFVRVLLEDIEVMVVAFSSENYANALFARLKLSDSFIAQSEERRQKAKERAEAKGDKVILSDEDIKKIEAQILRKAELELIEKSITPAAKLADEHLLNVVRMIFEGLFIQATAFAGANEMRDLLQLQDQKYSAKDIKKSLFDPTWEMIKPLAGVTHGGKRTRKESEFTWNKDKAREFYKAVQALPRISKKPIWEYAEEQLRANDYDPEIVTWLQSNPAFADSPERLLREAASVWRSFEEEGKSVPAESRPLAFAFRHACHKLGYPEKAYNTMRARYYEGKKAEETIS